MNFHMSWHIYLSPMVWALLALVVLVPLVIRLIGLWHNGENNTDTINTSNLPEPVRLSLQAAHGGGLRKAWHQNCLEIKILSVRLLADVHADMEKALGISMEQHLVNYMVWLAKLDYEDIKGMPAVLERLRAVTKGLTRAEIVHGYQAKDEALKLTEDLRNVIRMAPELEISTQAVDMWLDVWREAYAQSLALPLLDGMRHSTFVTLSKLGVDVEVARNGLDELGYTELDDLDDALRDLGQSVEDARNTKASLRTAADDDWEDTLSDLAEAQHDVADVLLTIHAISPTVAKNLADAVL